jgi:hypothetical protein
MQYYLSLPIPLLLSMELSKFARVGEFTALALPAPCSFAFAMMPEATAAAPQLPRPYVISLSMNSNCIFENLSSTPPPYPSPLDCGTCVAQGTDVPFYPTSDSNGSECQPALEADALALVVCPSQKEEEDREDFKPLSRLVGG